MMSLSRVSRRIVVALSLATLVPAVAAAQPFAYVANLGSDDVSVVDLGTRAVIATLAAGDDPNGSAVSPDGRRAYVSNFLSDTVTVIDTATNTTAGIHAVGKGPVGIAISPDGRRLYVANRGAGSVSAIDTVDGALIAEVRVGSGPNSVAVTPDGSKIYVTNSFSHDPGIVSVIDGEALEVGTSVEVQRSPNRVAITPDGRKAYATNFRSWNVSVIDTASDRVETTYRISGRPSGVAVNPNGAYAYVTTRDAGLEIVDTATDQVVSGLRVGRSASAVATTRNGGQGVVANFGAGTVTVLDLADEAVLGEVPVGVKPFAVSVNCVGAGCDEQPWTPKPTRTRTVTPTQTKTPSRPIPTPTRTRPTATPTRTPRAAAEISSGSAAPGATVDIAVRLRTGGIQVVAVAIDLVFAPPLSVARRANGRPDCSVNPEIEKPSTAFSYISVECPSEAPCTGVRAGVISFAGDSTPIADGSDLFSCRVAIDRAARPGPHEVGAEASVVLPSGAEEAARVRAGVIQVGQNRSTAQLAGEVDATTLLRLCAQGPNDGQPCSDDPECPSGACVAAASVCDGGPDDGLLCQCAGGRCRSEEGGPTCGDRADSGRCDGGERAGDCCELELNCAAGDACVLTQRVCAAGPSKGSPCVDDRHCPSSACSSFASVCRGGDFDGFSCVDNRDCPRGMCSSEPTATPAAPAPVSTRPSASSSGDGDGCSIAAAEGGRSAWFLALPGWLWARHRRRARTL